MKYLDTENNQLAREAFVVILQQNWENVRHIKNERLWFTNIYALAAAATLSFIPSYFRC